jgi:hypothetical protein
MGYETRCRVRVTDSTGVRASDSATVLLETDELIVRGDARIRVPRATITSVAARAGVVTVEAPVGTVSLMLGAEAAAKWKAKLEEAPKRVVDKLDVKRGMKVWLFGITDRDLIAQVEHRAGTVVRGNPASSCDVVLVEVDSLDELERIDRAATAIIERGAVWVVHPKGKHGVPDTAIFTRAKMLGFTYTKVARISETHSAEKLVRPKTKG